ncbi:response regulator receiver sensor signal transduction histidine kinase [Nitritalea halalkaliphila LW7]|uniref:histidine kinase n=1 Tax=Nitritalea halalkaliphila LW7 TaxID=1189621 RepID=I5C0V5_9BACT|nr:response regulator [Nitritalea halalkaliphila]EIM75457.1 response regulator receiver sensor signal transduction histidine kinase [Nitritalea halalkaliphila LW7]
MKPIQIIITEDDFVSAMVLKKVLQASSYEIIGIATTGEQTLDMLTTKRPDVILMDITLGGELDGITTTEIINARYGFPVIYISGHSDHATLEKVVGTNPGAYVTKPYDERELYMVIELTVSRYRREQDMQRYSQELEEKVKARTRALDKVNAELKQALAREQELNDLKTKIVLNVSHGFKTPLTSILSSSQLISKYAEFDHELAPKFQRHAARIEKAVQNLNNMLNGMLLIGKSDEKKLQALRQQIHMPTFISELLEMVKLAHNFQVQISVNQQHVPEFIYSDLDLMHQICDNLLSNALKYSPEGGIVKLDLGEREIACLSRSRIGESGSPSASRTSFSNGFSAPRMSD